jgi:hypothetical protein
LQFGPATSAGRLHFVVTFPGKFADAALADALDGPGEAVEKERVRGSISTDRVWDLTIRGSVARSRRGLLAQCDV